MNNEYEVVEKEYEEVKKKVKTGSYYDGHLIELIGYHILRFLLTVFTVGICRAWGTCMLIRYKVNHTVIDGKRLKFEGTGAGYFVQKFKWYILTFITLGIYSFFIPYKRLKWIVSHIHFEDENYIVGDSYFDGGIFDLLLINVLCALLMAISFGLLYPLVHCVKVRWIAKNSIINMKRLIFKGKPLNYFLKNVIWGFFTIITFGIFSLWLGIVKTKWQVKHTHIKLKDESTKRSREETIAACVVAAICILIGGLVFAKVVTNIFSVSESSKVSVYEVREAYKEVRYKLTGLDMPEKDVKALENQFTQKKILKKYNLNKLLELKKGHLLVVHVNGGYEEDDDLYYHFTLTRNSTTYSYYFNNHEEIEMDEYIEVVPAGNIFRGIGYEIRSLFDENFKDNVITEYQLFE